MEKFLVWMVISKPLLSINRIFNKILYSDWFSTWLPGCPITVIQWVKWDDLDLDLWSKINKSTLVMDSSVPLMHHDDLSNPGSLIEIQIIWKEPNL